MIMRDAVEGYVNRAFILGALLTQDTEHAESIVTAAIEAVPVESFSETALLSQVASTAWMRSPTAERLPPIPRELQSVSRLPRELRWCFSMRVLAGITTQVCAQITGLHEEQVSYFVHLSMQMLAKSVRFTERRMPMVAR
jgi:DNA-directed RNA polymerase specialized sigma24 family protein